MGTVSLDLFMTLDGIYQGPGGAGEDTSGGFTLGGWQAAFADAESGAAIMAGINRMDALLLGRRTYDIFAGYWPQLGNSNPIAAKFNSMDKYVVSRALEEAGWDGTTVLSSAEETAQLKDRHENIHVVGSGDLAGSLLAAGILDRLNLFLYPVTLGSGKRIFSGDGGLPAAFTLAEPPQAFPAGVLRLVYDRNGVPVTGLDAGS
ncbi:dihydrofolate reductase family protein [Arthrobacter gandavensis]|uniref:dihydrofolate reductase family protein n=1 Tax=Arthrobacter gandavensis TaxID=169960 RepID=UPI0018904EC2|nr:dihydrofolate reductase family protein [Arthrobacter gandavensis]MBF4994939.1 dihydrofolate reductase family protein [Arthrobacter gandavensis]